MNIQPFPTTVKAQLACATAINTLLKDNKKPVLFLCSLSTIGIRQSAAILDNVEAQLLGLRATIGVLDEKYSDDDTVNTFAQLTRTTLYKKAIGYGVQIIDTHVYPEETMEAHALRFQQELQEWKENNSDGIIIAVHGIGADGTIAGILPQKNENNFNHLWGTTTSVVQYEAEKTAFPRRVTTTPFFLKLIEYNFVYIDGIKKTFAYRELVREERPLHIQPAQLLKQMKHVEVFSALELYSHPFEPQ